MTEDTSKISVIMPAFNSAAFIKDSIDSVLAQTYQNLELIVINDGSTDNTDSIVSEYGEAIKYINADNRGVSAARNNAIKVATGDWLAFCDSDDIWHKDKLSMQMKSIGDSAWSYTDSFYMGEEYSPTTKRSDLSILHQGRVFKSLILENFLTTSSLMIKKQLLIDKGLFDEDLAALEDWDLWLNIAIDNDIVYVPQPLLHYRVYAGSTSRKARLMLPLHKQVINNAIRRYHDPDKEHVRNLALQKSCSICSYIAEQGGDYRFAFKSALLAFKYRARFESAKRVAVTLIKLIISVVSRSSK